MIDLSTAAIIEKNRVSTDGVWLQLAEIVVENQDVIRLVNNNENIEFLGQTYYMFAFELSSVKQNSTEIPETTLSVSNVTGAIQQVIEQYDGIIGAKVSIKIINTNVPDYIAAEENFVVTGTSADRENVVLKLGTDFLFTRRFPNTRVLKDYCPFKFKGPQCGYSGNLPSCNKTLSDCRAHGNSVRFGGEPTIPQGGLYVRS